MKTTHEQLADLEEALTDTKITDKDSRALCAKCNQEDHGQTGEHPCAVCGLPLVHDKPSPSIDGSYAQAVLIGSLQTELVATCQQLAHWKANHDNVVKKLQLFTQRDDLPVDRLPAYRHVVELEKQLAEAQARERDLHSYALKLALDAECLWLDCKNNVVVSRWMAPLFEAINNVKQCADANDSLALQSAIEQAVAEAVEPYKRDAERWKERAEFEYSKWMYPDNPGLAVGALDAHMRAGWTWKEKQEAIDAALAAKGCSREMDPDLDLGCHQPVV